MADESFQAAETGVSYMACDDWDNCDSVTHVLDLHIRDNTFD